jgi:hypothetical protein
LWSRDATDDTELALFVARGVGGVGGGVETTIEWVFASTTDLGDRSLLSPIMTWAVCWFPEESCSVG